MTTANVTESLESNRKPGPSHPVRAAVDVLTSPRFGPVIITAVLFLVMFGLGGGLYEGFLSAQVFVNLFVDNAYLLVLAVGMTFVILSGGIDLSVGAVVALSTVIAARLLQAGANPGLVIIVVLLLASVLGLLVGLMIHVFGVQPFIATLAAMFLARGLCYVISPQSISITDPVFTAIAQVQVPLGGTLTISASALIAIVVVAIAFLVLRYTRFGRTVYALGGSEASGLLMGLPVGRTKVGIYAPKAFTGGLRNSGGAF